MVCSQFLLIFIHYDDLWVLTGELSPLTLKTTIDGVGFIAAVLLAVLCLFLLFLLFPLFFCLLFSLTGHLLLPHFISSIDIIYTSFKTIFRG